MFYYQLISFLLFVLSLSALICYCVKKDKFENKLPLTSASKDTTMGPKDLKDIPTMLEVRKL